MRSGIAEHVMHVRSEIERYRIAKARKKAINVKSQGESSKSLVKAIASPSPLLAYALSKMYSVRLSTFELVRLKKDTMESCCKSRETV